MYYVVHSFCKCVGVVCVVLKKCVSDCDEWYHSIVCLWVVVYVSFRCVFVCAVIGDIS